MFKWGSFVGLPGGAGTFNLAATLAPAYSNAVLSVQLTPFGFSTSPLNFNVRLVSIGTPPSQIVTYYISNGTNTGPAASGVGGFTYFAIGY